MAAEFREQARHEIFRRRGRGDVKLAAGNAFEAVDGLVGLAQPCEHRARMAGQFDACAGQVHPPADLLEQRQADIGLELLERDRDGRLGEVQFAGRAAEMQMPRGGFEDTKLFQGGAAQGRHLSISLSI